MDKPTISLRDLNAAFEAAENQVAAEFGGRTCSVRDEQGRERCPICAFRLLVKKFLVTHGRLTMASLPENQGHVCSNGDQVPPFEP